MRMQLDRLRRDGRAWWFDDYRIAYDFESVASELEQSDIPFAARYAQMIQEANWLPRSA